MADPTPRQVIKGLLQGIAPARPLFLPIVFSLGCRVENVSLRTFLSNPTKISNSLRQIRGYLQCEGLACYFDPSLEADALGGTLEWMSEDHPPRISWPTLDLDRLQGGWPSPEDMAQRGRVPVACEVIRRLKSTLREQCLLMAGVTGPFTLASGLFGLGHGEVRSRLDLPLPVVEFAASVTSQISTKFVEAGADLILVVERVLPTLSAERCEEWASLLAPAFNVIRFYEALPVLLLTDSISVAANRDALFNREWECVLCPTLRGLEFDSSTGILESKVQALGVAMPIELFDSAESGGQGFLESIHRRVAELQPVLITTAGDLPPATDLKRATKILAELRRQV